MIHRIGSMIGSKNSETMIRDFRGDGSYGEVWVRAVPHPFYGGLSDRVCDAWAIIRGNAYAVRWPEPGELERALKQ